MNPSCLGNPQDWALPLDVAARCTGTTVQRAGELAVLGGAAVLVAVFLALVLALILRRVR